MSELSAITCRSCGGTVRLAVGQRAPTCLFCGAEDVVPTEPPEGLEDPEGAIPFSTSRDQAHAVFAEFATSSFWYPSDLRQARLELQALLLPAWAWSGDVETHWTGLVSASTRSGKAPTSGHQTMRFHQVLVPASRSLRLAELRALGPYDERALGPVQASGDAAVELSELTRSAARARAHAEMLARHRASIQAERGLVKIRASSLATDLSGRPVLVPVWIGAYRYGDRTFRVLVNGQSGQLVGDAPISWRKVAAVAAGVLGFLLVMVLLFALLASA